MSRPSIQFAIKYFKGKSDLIIAEVGVSDGSNALDMYNVLKPKKMYLIDFYEEYLDFNATKQKICCQRMLNRFKDNQEIHFIKKHSKVASLEVPDNSLDLVYIDAKHEELDVIIDVVCWYPKVKIGGIICGHDYDNFHDGVMKTVNRMFKEFHHEYDWWTIKKKDGYD